MKALHKTFKFTIATAMMVILAGCGDSDKSSSAESEAATQANSSATPLPADLLSTTPLNNALSVVEARQNVTPDAEIVITGYVGGRVEPLVQGRAILTLADSKIMTRCDDIPGDGCSTPWDACCISPEIKKSSTASIQVTDADGNILKNSLEGFGGIKPGSVVTVMGKLADNATDDIFIVNASKIHVADQP